MADDTSPFPAYPKMAELPASWGLDEAGWRQLRRGRFVVTEKIHGACCCVALAPDGALRVGGRRGWLGVGEPFFAFERPFGRLRAAFEGLHAAVRAASAPEGAPWLVLYGELFGGAWPQPGVAPVPGVAAIQTGVWYSPDVELWIFDAAWWWPRADPAAEVGEELLWWGFGEVEAACRAAGVPCAPALMEGTWEEALAWPTRFASTVPGRLGLPPLEGNLAEGIVIKPAQALVVEGPAGPLRPILKRKLAEFAEDARYHGAQRWGHGVRDPGLGQYALDLIEHEVMARLNLNRLASAVSKHGRPDPAWPERVRRLVDEIVADVQGEVEAACPEAWASLGDEERALVRAVLVDEAGRLVAGLAG